MSSKQSSAFVNHEKFYVHQNPVKPILIREELLHPILNMQFVNISKFYTLF